MNLNELKLLTTTSQAIVVALVREPDGNIRVAYSFVSASAFDEDPDVVGSFIFRSLSDQIKLGRA